MKKLVLALSFLFVLGLVSVNAQTQTKTKTVKEPVKTEQTTTTTTKKPVKKGSKDSITTKTTTKTVKKTPKSVKTTTEKKYAVAQKKTAEDLLRIFFEQIIDILSFYSLSHLRTYLGVGSWGNKHERSVGILCHKDHPL